MSNDLSVWIEDNLLDIVPFIEGTNLLDTPIGLMIELEPIRNKVFDKKMDLIVYEKDDEGNYKSDYAEQIFNLVNQYQVQYFIYEFGGNFFYTTIGKSDLNILRYIGDHYTNVNLKGAFLGVHGKYERMNGTRDYSDWCKKAKFLGFNQLAIAEQGTLAGTLPFQLACKKAEIQAILGATIHVEHKDGNRSEVKLYVINEQGWINLLSLNRQVTIENNGWITVDQLWKHNEGLILVIKPDSKTITKEFLNKAKRSFKELALVQLTTNEYKSSIKDLELLNSTKLYFDNWMDQFNPILINDAYCLDYEDVHLKKRLNDSIKIHNTETTNHYFRSIEEQFTELEELFDEQDDRLIDIFKSAVLNTKIVADLCKYQIDLKNLFLPQYEMTEDERSIFEDDNEALFDELVFSGCDDLIDYDKYDKKEVYDRLNYEISVIKKGGFVDYFLILWDIINWCDAQNILTGVGRGSAGGSLVAYALGIIKLNPLDYDLLFERFLNEGRVGEIVRKPVRILETSHGEIELDLDEKVTVFRQDKQIDIDVKGLKEGDFIDEAFVLERVKIK